MIKNTVIEFYDEEPIANISACLRYKFERVIFVGFSEWNNTDDYSKIISGEWKRFYEYIFIDSYKK